MTALLNWRIWAAVMVAIFLAGTHWKAYTAGQKSIQAEWNAEKVEQSRLSIALQNKNVKTTAELQANTDKRNGELHAQINRIASERDRLADELRNRPERPSEGDLSTATGDGKGVSGCSGKGLYREDGGFLVRESSDAAVLQAGLKSCYAQYDDARTKLEAINENKE